MPLIFIIFFFEKRSLLLPLITRHIRTAIDYPKQTALVYRRSYSSRYISFVPPKKSPDERGGGVMEKSSRVSDTSDCNQLIREPDCFFIG